MRRCSANTRRGTAGRPRSWVAASRARLAAARLGGHLATTAYLLPQRSVQLEARFGIAIFPDHAQDLDGLLAKADAALTVAKREGGPVIRIAPGPVGQGAENSAQR